MMRRLYNLLLHTAGWGLVPLLAPKSGSDPSFTRGRFGDYDGAITPRGKPRIWLHAASVGEVSGAAPIIRALHERLDDPCIILTVATYQGFLAAQRQLPRGVQVLAFPLDFQSPIEKALNLIQPDIYVALESEFWPNLYHLLDRRGIPRVLLNGRLSKQSARIYSLFGPLFRPIFARFQWLALHSQDDLSNVLKLGAPPDRTLVLGSSKYEGLLTKAHPQQMEKWRTRLDIPCGAPVLVGGSLRRFECIDLPEVYRELNLIRPDLIAIFAPRHLEQLPNMGRWLRAQGIPFQFLTPIAQGSEKRETCVILVDRIGSLFELYALGDLIFCGGTLAPVGGHNILEPAAWKKAVFYGPNLQKVDYEHRILTNHQASFVVQDKTELLAAWRYWIAHLKELRAHGDQAHQALGQMTGVALKQVDLIASTLPRKSTMYHLHL
ncbi:3-deoxy-D-manno-octulosonic acid transferase [Desulfoferrobacter suflitae]|uniref:3-deoxy-D-manno-octulosonic acid transferase n=1 Tax=Desulfoferrobacter suflitae TaxID=2865782 RepID=UPI002164918C|nr:glycosyltransferase N-terminal domain-containing protein [Desulfoferrobacter suflitae]MCK8602458.1 hypothetical protein [Desulfoferrobacter suflitae]